MKITDYRFETYEMKMERPIGDANGVIGEDISSGAVFWIKTDEGISGVAPGGSSAVAQLFHLIEGEDPRGVVGLWMRMVDFVFKGGNEGEMNAAINAIDTALWDLKAKIADEPLWQTFGAREGRTKAYASGIDLCLDDDQLFAFYRRMAEKGIDSGKLKVGLDMQADLRRLGIMQEALSIAADRPRLLIDSNEYWSAKEAIIRIQRIEQDFDITWAEEPARRWDYDGLRQVSRNISAAVASGENLNHIGDFYPLVSQQAVDVVNIAGGHSGFTGCKQVANLCHAYELPVSMMNCQANYAAHLAAALPNHMMMEVVDPGREQCIDFNHAIEDGFIQLSDEPGLGISIDEEVLAHLQANPPEPHRHRRNPFPRRKGAGRFIVPPSREEAGWLVK
jgi:L-alanine-DL-glutamate epimerase-like enolase superfamily enzyme